MPEKREKRAAASESSKSGAKSKAPVSRQTAGGVAGAVIGGIVGGPVGALAGGVAGAYVGDSSDKGKKPIKRAMETIRTELKEGKTIKALKSMTFGKKSSGKAATAKKDVSSKKAAPVKKKIKSAPVKKKAKSVKATKAASSSQGKPTKKRAKK